MQSLMLCLHALTKENNLKAIGGPLKQGICSKTFGARRTWIQNLFLTRGMLWQEMEAVARLVDFPAISAMVASDGNMACSEVPAGNGTAAQAPSPAADGPTFFRCGYWRPSSAWKLC